jgi:hypothetical protein
MIQVNVIISAHRRLVKQQIPDARFQHPEFSSYPGSFRLLVQRVRNNPSLPLRAPTMPERRPAVLM